MSNESRLSPENFQSDPMGLVSHINRSPKSGMSKMQLTIPISLRARLARASLDHSIPQLSLIRTAISAYLDTIEARFPPQPRPSPLDAPIDLVVAPVASPEAAGPVPELMPVESEPATEAEPELELESELMPTVVTEPTTPMLQVPGTCNMPDLTSEPTIAPMPRPRSSRKKS